LTTVNPGGKPCIWVVNPSKGGPRCAREGNRGEQPGAEQVVGDVQHGDATVPDQLVEQRDDLGAMQKYRSPAIELYGATGVLQLLGDDWPPDGFEQWTNDRGPWELFGKRDPDWPWTDGLRHLVDCAENGT